MLREAGDSGEVAQIKARVSDNFAGREIPPVRGLRLGSFGEKNRFPGVLVHGVSV